MITTHVLDTALGKPGIAIPVTLSRQEQDSWTPVSAGQTNDDGRIPGWLDDKPALVAGVYRIRFELDDYFARQSQSAFYPFAEIVFRVEDPAQHFHIPLLLSPFSYSTYRGS
ncbi:MULTISPECIES: hydroxyisourate hydrolase [unclassified Oceanobacter]|jgi:5-hydroxyisourate hydrolase|uniref:hydroxyisourate hydrolase n=1 Tax=unclassified Oceanobacter TaxID=2620260 RepID=UPI0027351D15|nr:MULTISPECIES: hydroxyisourate hydrolase [unclassified Oceanobacter]MDP2505893.1 hydroxyisourate hydrolase [Oceanobacter sp. 3_MG-2023]MDP2548376.1 hydroxyisourate hydrolase [Oceanobacter sp. 4_MG-2023]